MSQVYTKPLLSYAHLVPKPITYHMQSKRGTATFVAQANTKANLHTITMFVEAIKDG